MLQIFDWLCIPDAMRPEYGAVVAANKMELPNHSPGSLRTGKAFDLRRAASAPVFAGSPPSRGATHHSYLSSTDVLSFSAPRNNKCFPFGDHTGRLAEKNFPAIQRGSPPPEG